MKMNRRNALIGLGAIATGGGALFGSGAFSSVEAKRTVDLSLAGDGAALLELKPGTGATGIIATTRSNDQSGTVNTIEFSEGSLNADARTEFENALEVTNNGDQTVEFYVDEGTAGVGDPSSSGNVLEFEKGGSTTDITSSSVNGNSITLSAGGGTDQVDVIVDFTGTDDESDLPSAVTLVAAD